MRAKPLVRAITAATTLTLAVSSVTLAQSVDEREIQFPEEMGSTLVTAVVTNSLDDAGLNELITQTAKSYHSDGDRLGGKGSAPVQPKKNKPDKAVPRGGFINPGSFEGTDAVTGAVIDITGESEPNLVIVSGGDWKSNVGIARSKSGSTILEINGPGACVDADGRADATGECAGEASVIPGNYGAMEFAVEEGAYLAGVVAARESRGQPLGIIAGAPDCLECDRYVTGFINGARSVEPGIDIELAYQADEEIAGFSDKATARTYAETFIDVYQPSVLLPVGRGATMGMVEAACEAGVKVIGTGSDISAVAPQYRRTCVMASIVPDVARAVEEAMYLFSSGQNPPLITYDLAEGGITVTDEWRTSPTKRVDTNEFYDEAELAILTGQVEACPDGCGMFPPDLAVEELASAS